MICLGNKPTIPIGAREREARRMDLDTADAEERKRRNSSKKIYALKSFNLGFPGCSDSKESACDAEDPGSIPRLGRSPGEENGHPL